MKKNQIKAGQIQLLVLRMKKKLLIKTKKQGIQVDQVLIKKVY